MIGFCCLQADIWAFGCVAYELMIQHHPFFNTDANENEKGNKYNSKDEEPAAISRMAQLDNYLQKHLFVEECPEFQIFISQVRICNFFSLNLILLVRLITFEFTGTAVLSLPTPSGFRPNVPSVDFNSVTS